MKKLYLILLYFLVYAVIMVFLVPPFEANDEPDHLAYINFVAAKGQLPVQTVDSLRINKEGHQFPLYYLAASCIESLFLKNASLTYSIIPNKNNCNYGGKESLVPVYNHVYNGIFRTNSDKFVFYSLRIFQVIISLVNLFFIYKVSGFFFREEKFRLLTVFIVGALPQFAFVSSYISNDGLANLFSTLTIFTFLKMMSEKKTADIFIFSAVLAIGLIVKKTIFFFFPVLFIVGAWIVFSKKINYNKAFQVFASLAISIGLFSAWFFIRNLNLYDDIFLTKVEMNTVPFYIELKSIFSFYFIYPFIPGLFGSFWGVFGWMNAALPFYIYVALFFFCAICSYFAFSRFTFAKFNNRGFLFSVLSVTFCLAGVIYYNTFYSQHQGRFLFPVISLIVIFLVYGIKNFYEKFNRNNYILYFTILLFVFIDIVSIFTLRNFYYDISKYL